jgi:hypothetical protein
MLDGLGAPAGVERALREVAGLSLMLAGAGLLHHRRRVGYRGKVLDDLERAGDQVRSWVATLDRRSLRRLRGQMLGAGIPAPIVASMTGCPIRTAQQAAHRASLTQLLQVRRGNQTRHTTAML